MMKVLRVKYGSPDAPQRFTESLRNTGFAVVSDHPISHSLINEVFADWAKFFDSPEKMNYKYDPVNQAGYFPFRTENAKGSKVKDLKEFFHLYPNSRIPDGISGRTKEMSDRMTALAVELLGWIQKCAPAEVSAKFSMPLTSMTEGSNETLLRPIHYPPLSDAEEEGAIRAAAHEDINLITLLPAATAPGLEVKDLEGNWIAVECNPGDIVINSGDMLQMASGGYFVSTTHRVVNPRGPAARQPRYSMPLFLHPRPDVPLSPQYTAKGYLEERLREIGLLKTGQSKGSVQAPATA